MQIQIQIPKNTNLDTNTKNKACICQLLPLLCHSFSGTNPKGGPSPNLKCISDSKTCCLSYFFQNDCLLTIFLHTYILRYWTNTSKSSMIDQSIFQSRRHLQKCIFAAIFSSDVWQIIISKKSEMATWSLHLHSQQVTTYQPAPTTLISAIRQLLLLTKS